LEDKKEEEEESLIKITDLKVFPEKFPKKMKGKTKRAYQRAR
jgi:hypothetical protein